MVQANGANVLLVILPHVFGLHLLGGSGRGDFRVGQADFAALQQAQRFVKQFQPSALVSVASGLPDQPLWLFLWLLAGLRADFWAQSDEKGCFPDQTG